MGARPSPLRRLYRAVWWSITLPLTVFGVGCAFLILGAGVALALLVVSAGIAALADWERRLARSRTGPRTEFAATSLVGGIVMVALTGLTREMGAAGLGLSALLAAVGAHALRRERPNRHPAPSEAPAAIEPQDLPEAERIPADALPPLAAVRALSTPQLCWAWRVSYLPLRRPDIPSHRIHYLAELRCICLDELEQRNPVSFRQWLPTARAASDPARFFCRPPTD